MSKATIGKLFIISISAVIMTMCTPPETTDADSDAAELARLDSLREVRCPRLFSSAAEYYKNRDWTSTVRVYGELVDLGCDREDPEEVYQYYAIAFEYMGQYDSSEYVLLKGLQLLDDNVNLRKRLVYSYMKQNKTEQQINELDRLSFLAPEDLEIKADLANLYGEQGRYDDQITVLKELLDLDPNNEGAQSDLANAYEKSGRDPLDVYKNRFENNPDNVSYGMDYADRLVANDRLGDAIDVLKQVLDADPTSKVAHRKLASVLDKSDRLDEASRIYERLFKLDPRDFRVAIKLSEVFIENQEFGSAFNWADKAMSLSGNGEAMGAKGNVYYKAFQNCRSADISLDDRVVASLAYKYFEKAENKGFNRFNRSGDWLKDNEVLFGKAQWFMMDADKKNKGYILPEGNCYSWITEKLNKEADW